MPLRPCRCRRRRAWHGLVFSCAKARISASTRLRGVILPRKATTGPVNPCRAPERSRLRRLRELREVDRVGNQPDAVLLHADVAQLPPLRLGDRQHTVGVPGHVVPQGHVEEPLGQVPALDDRGRAVGRQHVGDAGLAQAARGDHAWQVAAGVQVRDVERQRVLTQERPQADRREHLLVIGEPVRQVREHARRDALRGAHRVPRAEAGAGAIGRLQAIVGVAGVGRADRHAVAAVGETARHCLRKARNAPVCPCVPGVRRHMEDA